jgi:hypothetical protein
MNGTVVLTRSGRRWWFGIQSMKLALDGDFVATLTGGGSVRVEVPEGQHSLRARFRTVWSPEIPISVSTGEETYVSCENDRMGYPVLLLSPNRS